MARRRAQNVEPVSGSCAQCCLCSVFALVFTTFGLWISLLHAQPSCSIEKFYIPALNRTANDTSNTTISFDLKLGNDKVSRVYYDTLNITLYYGHNLSFPIGNVSIPAFRQGHKKSTKRVENVNVTSGGIPWKTAIEEVSNGTSVFRVDLATKFRYKTFSVMTRRRKMNVGANVTVNDQGIKSRKKGIMLSGATVNIFHCAQYGFLLLSMWVLF